MVATVFHVKFSMKNLPRAQLVEVATTTVYHAGYPHCMQHDTQSAPQLLYNNPWCAMHGAKYNNLQLSESFEAGDISPVTVYS